MRYQKCDMGVIQYKCNEGDGGACGDFQWDPDATGDPEGMETRQDHVYVNLRDVPKLEGGVQQLDLGMLITNPSKSMQLDPRNLEHSMTASLAALGPYYEWGNVMKQPEAVLGGHPGGEMTDKDIDGLFARISDWKGEEKLRTIYYNCSVVPGKEVSHAKILAANRQGVPAMFKAAWPVRQDPECFSSAQTQGAPCLSGKYCTGDNTALLKAADYTDDNSGVGRQFAYQEIFVHSSDAQRPLRLRQSVSPLSAGQLIWKMVGPKLEEDADKRFRFPAPVVGSRVMNLRLRGATHPETSKYHRIYEGHIGEVVAVDAAKEEATVTWETNFHIKTPLTGGKPVPFAELTVVQEATSEDDMRTMVQNVLKCGSDAMPDTDAAGNDVPQADCSTLQIKLYNENALWRRPDMWQFRLANRMVVDHVTNGEPDSLKREDWWLRKEMFCDEKDFEDVVMLRDSSPECKPECSPPETCYDPQGKNCLNVRRCDMVGYRHSPRGGGVEQVEYGSFLTVYDKCPSYVDAFGIALGYTAYIEMGVTLVILVVMYLFGCVRIKGVADRASIVKLVMDTVMEAEDGKEEEGAGRRQQE